MKKWIILGILAISAIGLSGYTEDMLTRMEKVEAENQVFLDTGVTAEVKGGTANIYEAWDKELNKVYKLLMDKLSPSEKNKLRNEQRKWIKIRDQIAKADAKDWKGGTWEDIMYTSGLISATKERTIELSKRYDKLKR